MRVTVGDLALDLTDDQVCDLRRQLGVACTDDDPMLNTEQAAARLGFSTEYVRDHAAELGGVKLTDGPKAPWRFDPAKLGHKDHAAEPPPSPQVTPRRRAPRHTGAGQLLKSRG
ncbi:MAG TPA: hypothetical protein VJL81_11225 [Solirubrobacterales bacterium]|nr:hypothetical protein [Solirubrobacterales bacterium]